MLVIAEDLLGRPAILLREAGAALADPEELVA